VQKIRTIYNQEKIIDEYENLMPQLVWQAKTHHPIAGSEGRIGITFSFFTSN
jgi:hypothetical protein